MVRERGIRDQTPEVVWEADWSAMFSVECPCHRARVLLGPESIVALVSGDDGIEVHWRCTCGQMGVWLTGGRRSERGWAPAA